MKKIIFLVLMINSAITSANICENVTLESLKADEFVVYDGEMMGVAIGTNPHTGMVAIQSYPKATEVISRQFSTLAFGSGCSSQICKNDFVLFDEQMYGLVVAINPSNGNVSIQSDQNKNFVYTRNPVNIIPIKQNQDCKSARSN